MSNNCRYSLKLLDEWAFDASECLISNNHFTLAAIRDINLLFVSVKTPRYKAPLIQPISACSRQFKCPISANKMLLFLLFSWNGRERAVITLMKLFNTSSGFVYNHMWLGFDVYDCSNVIFALAPDKV